MTFARRLAMLRADFSFAAIDAFLIAMAYMAAFGLRFLDGTALSTAVWDRFLRALPVIVVLHLVTNVIFGAYGHVWQYASVAEALRLVAAAATAAFIELTTVIVIHEVFGPLHPVPILVVALGAMFALVGMGAIRFRSRLFSFKRWEGAAPVRTLVVGTGRAAADLARHRGGEHPLQVIGFVSLDDVTDRRLAGLPVLGTLADLPELVERFSVKQVVLAVDTPDTGNLVRQVVDLCLANETRLRILPGVETVLDDSGGVRDMRDVEIADLLPRAEVDTDLAQVRTILEGKRVLVTGAGGSIGSEIVRRVLEFAPEQVVALDHDETHLHDAMVGWAGHDVMPELALVDIRDGESVRRLFAERCPEVVFHAAALKHVPMLEGWPEEAVKTNVVGTSNVLQGMQVCEPERFVLISTDKAVNPSSVMGASKRVAEMMVQAAASGSSHCTYSSVRFGNVLGSRGSVVPTFVAQIRNGGPVTITDPAMVRYFMTVGEAVQLVLQAAAISKGAELFVLDMGQPVRIEELAHRMIRLAGLVPGRDIDVVTVGRRPGEKLSETLSEAPLLPSTHQRIGLAPDGHPGSVALFDTVSTLERLADRGDRGALRETLGAASGGSWNTEEVVVDLDAVDDLVRWA